MSYLTRPFLGFIFALEPVWLPLFVIDVIALVVMIFAERFNPRTLIFWISLVVIVPFVGILLYLAFGSNLYTRWRLSGRKRSEDERFLEGEGDVPPEGDASSGRNCFERASFDSGHSLLPEPPESNIICIYDYLVSSEKADRHLFTPSVQ